MPGLSAFSALHEDHEYVRDLMATVLVEHDAGELRRMMNVLEARLLIHMKIEEEILFPALLERVTKRDGRALIHGAVADHDLVLHLRRLIMEGQPGTEEYHGKLHALDKLLKHHFEEEEGALFRLARDTFDFALFSELQDKMNAARKKLEDEVISGRNLDPPEDLPSVR